MRSVALAALLVAAAGVPWALTQWAPFAFVGVEVNRLSAGGGATTARAHGGTYHRIHADDGAGPPSPTALELDHRGLLGREEGPGGPDADPVAGEEPSTGELAGVYLGILNFYTAFPQLLGTFVGMVVFALVEPGKSRELAGAPEGPAEGGARKGGVNAIAVCMFLGGLSSLGAAYATWRLRFVR